MSGPLPVCSDCATGDLDFLCRRGRDLDLEHVARTYLAFSDALAASPGDTEVPGLWAYDCATTLVEASPDLGWRFVLSAARVAQTPRQAGAIAAGFLEDLLNLHGPAVIARIEDTAARSARMRYLLSGVWASDIDQPTWARVLAARAPGPDMEKGAPQPPADG